jgi:hypothetical protein
VAACLIFLSFCWGGFIFFGLKSNESENEGERWCFFFFFERGGGFALHDDA